MWEFIVQSMLFLLIMLIIAFVCMVISEMDKEAANTKETR